MENPFLTTLPFNLPLKLDICQQIHYEAMRGAAKSLYPQAVPNPEFLRQVIERSRIQGKDAFLVHPVQIKEIFKGVTLAVYETIADLYCSRLGRNIQTVYQIITKLASEADVSPVVYEAIWAICLHLEERRQESIDCTLTPPEATWHLVQLRPKVFLQEDNSGVYTPILLCVIEAESSRVIAFKATEATKLREALGLVIYEALKVSRKPAQESTAGLVWTLPAKLITEIELPHSFQKVLRDPLKIDVEVNPPKTLLLEALRGDWDRSLAGRTLPKENFEAIFDNYLRHFHGYGPGNTQQDLELEFANLIGYNRDPAWQFPVLRQFLPEHQRLISPEGEVEYDQLHYADPLLKYWTGCQVTLRRSEHAEMSAWIYLNGEVLCQAMARELRRNDGSYRPNRPRGD